MYAINQRITSLVRVIPLVIIINNWLISLTSSATNTSLFTTDKLRTSGYDDIIARRDDVNVSAEVTPEQLDNDRHGLLFGDAVFGRVGHDEETTGYDIVLPSDVTEQPDQHMNRLGDSSADYTYVDDVSENDAVNYFNSDVNNGDVVDADGGNDTNDDSAIGDRQDVTGDIKQYNDVINYDVDHSDATAKAKNETDSEDNYQQGVEIGDSHPGAAEFRNLDTHFVRPLSGHQIGLRWLQQNHFDMRAVTYVWLGFLLTILCVVCLITAFNNRHMVTSAIQYTRTQYIRRRERWHNAANVDLRDESNTLLGHAQV